MLTVVQRVDYAKLSVEGELISSIDRGFVVLLGVEKGDTEEAIRYVAAKLPKLRIFPDQNDKTNLSLADVGGEVLLVSQFTLCGKCGKGHGNRPDFGNAEGPVRAKELYELMAREIAAQGITVKTGVFGAHMMIEQLNAGPFTVLI